MKTANDTRLLLLSLCLCVSCDPAFSAPPTYWRDVRPILRKSCTVCHNPRHLPEKEISGGIALDTLDKARKHVKARAADSPLYRVLVTKDTEKRMPLGTHPLTPAAIATIRAWIDAGTPEGERPADVGTTPTKGRRRKLDVVLTTNTTPAPNTLVAFKKRAPLTFALKIGPLSPVAAVAFYPEGNLLATGAYGRVVIWDLAEGSPARTITAVLGAVNDLRFSPDGKTLAVAGGQPSARGDLRLFNTADGKLLRVLPGHEDVIASVSWSPDGKTLASASYDQTVRTWDASTGKALKTFTHHSDFALAVAHSPDGKMLFTGSKDRSVRLIDADTGKGKFTFSDRDEDVLSVAARPDGKAAVASGMQPFLSWWDPATGARIRSMAGHRGAVHEVAFDKKGTILVSGGEDGTFRVWNGSTGAAMKTVILGPIVYAVAVSPDGKRAAAGCFDGTVRVIDPVAGRMTGTLISTPDGWLAQSPEGYTHGTDALLKSGQWRMAGAALPATVWNPLSSAAKVRQSLAGKVQAPVPLPK
jgi:WD40 repeat protein